VRTSIILLGVIVTCYLFFLCLFTNKKISQIKDFIANLKFKE
jgi:hypothetical protein